MRALRRTLDCAMAALLAIAFGVALGPRAAGQEGEAERQRATLQAQLRKLLDTTHTATWIEDSWERKGDATEASRDKVLWTSSGRIRTEVLSGRGKGAVLAVDGDRVTIKPPGVFGVLRLHYAVRDPKVLSLRGHDLRDVGFFNSLAYALDHWGSVKTTFEGGQAVLEFTNRDGLSQQTWIDLSDDVPTRSDVQENGELVERTRYEQVVVNAQLEAKE